MQNPNEKMTYEQQEARIAEKFQAFINLLTQRGILANPKVTDEKIRAARQKKDRDSYHNTLLLLQNYRTAFVSRQLLFFLFDCGLLQQRMWTFGWICLHFWRVSNRPVFHNFLVKTNCLNFADP